MNRSSSRTPRMDPRLRLVLLLILVLVGWWINRERTTKPGTSPPTPRTKNAPRTTRESGGRPAPRSSGTRPKNPAGTNTATFTPPEIAAPPPGQAAVGAMNIEWFSLGGKNARSATDLDNIASVIRATDAAVLGVEEVQDEQAINALTEKLPGWRAVLGTTGRQQRVGILWDSRVASVGRAQEWADINEGLEKAGPGSLRAPLYAPVKIGQFDFLLVVLHLKAMFEPEDLRTRREQLRRLRLKIAEWSRQNREPDVIIVGDFNDFADSKAMAELTQRDATGLNFVVADARLPESAVTYLGRSGRIDHVVVSSPSVSQQEWTGAAFAFPKPKGKEREVYEKSVSDHLPLWATFDTTRDRD